MRRRNERGQVLVLFIGVLLAFLAFTTLVVDGGLYLSHYVALQEDLDAACLAAAASQRRGLSYTTGFTASLNSNGITAEYYQPWALGSDGYVERGIQFGPHGTLMTGLWGPHEFSLAQFMGIYTMDVKVRSRCLYATLGVTPIAVQEPWFLDCAPGVVCPDFPDSVFPMLGQEAAAVTYTGNDFAGAIILHVWCTNSLGEPDWNCPDPLFFSPLTDSPSANTLKAVVQGTILTTVGAPFPPIGMRVPQISGVSNKFLVLDTMDFVYDVGDRIIVIIFDGDVHKPDPSYGNWDNIAVLYYALAEIVEFETNTMRAKFVGGPYDSPFDIEGFLSRTVPWDWYGG